MGESWFHSLCQLVPAHVLRAIGLPSINCYGKSGLSSMIFFPLVKPKLHQAHSGADKLSRTASRQGSQKIYELTGQKGESGQNLVLE